MNSPVFTFDIPVQAVPKGRPRVAKTKSGVRAFTPDKTRKFESYIKGWLNLRVTKPLETPLRMDMKFFFPVPKSYTIRDRNAALSGMKKFTKKPDLDNLEKAILDAAEGVLFLNDSQVCQKFSSKAYDVTPSIYIEVFEI